MIDVTSSVGDYSDRHPRRYVWISSLLVAMHGIFMLCRYGRLPIAPVLNDEVIINDPAISLAQGQGFVATSFGGGKYHLDQIFAHFPPVYGYAQALMFRLFGVSVYSMRAVTTVMSVATTVVLALVLYRLCRRGMVHWTTALIVNALYCTSVSLVSLERVARMESMVGLLTMLSLLSVLSVLSTSVDVHGFPPHSRKSPVLAVLLSGVFLALAVAVHPEAVTAVVLIAPLLLFVVPSTRVTRSAALLLFAGVPPIIGLMAYGRQLPAAVGQFVTIAIQSRSLGPDRVWMRTFMEFHTRAVLNNDYFLLFTMTLLLLPLVAFVRGARGVDDSRSDGNKARRRLSACVAVSGVAIVALMLLVFRMDVRRCQFLFGPLLILNTLIYSGALPLPRWQATAVWALAGLQCVAVCAYLSQKVSDRAATDPDRYMALLQSLPAGATVAASPHMWLNFREARRPFTLLLLSLGEGAWNLDNGNPLLRYDIILLDRMYAHDLPVYRIDAEEGRTKTSYVVGDEIIDVYTRKPNAGTVTVDTR